MPQRLAFGQASENTTFYFIARYDRILHMNERALLNTQIAPAKNAKEDEAALTRAGKSESAGVKENIGTGENASEGASISENTNESFSESFSASENINTSASASENASEGVGENAGERESAVEDTKADDSSLRDFIEESDIATAEAALFMEPNGISQKTLSTLLKAKESVANAALLALKDRLEKSASGLCVLCINDKWLMAPEKNAWDRISCRYSKRSGSFLSKSALETLAIVAYSQPITRSKIERLRGVNVDAMVRLLLEKGFIEEVGKSEELGKPVLYGTTKGFLTAFGLSSISDLPKLDETEEERFELAR